MLRCRNTTVFSDNSVTAWVVNLDQLKRVIALIDSEHNAATSKLFKTLQSPVNSVSLTVRDRETTLVPIATTTTLSGNGNVKSQNRLIQMISHKNLMILMS